MLPFSLQQISQTQRSSTVSPLRPDTTDDGQTYVPTSNSKLRTPKCKQSASSNELPIQHLMHCFTIPYTGNIYYLMAVAQLHHNSLLPTIVLTLINVSSWLPVNIHHMFSILHVVPIVLLLLISCWLYRLDALASPAYTWLVTSRSTAASENCGVLHLRHGMCTKQVILTQWLPSNSKQPSTPTSCWPQKAGVVLS